MTKICLVGKYPPIEGGVSTTTLWTALGLAERGHEVAVVTNADEVESQYRMVMRPEDQARRVAPAGSGHVTLHATAPFGRSMAYIPSANPYVTKIASLTMRAVREEGCEVVVAQYLEPYVVGAAMASHVTGVPLVVRHAGSDLDRLMLNPDLAPTYQEILRGAAAVLTRPALVDRFRRIGVSEEAILVEPAFGRAGHLFYTDAPAWIDDEIIELMVLANNPAAGAARPVLARPGLRLGIYGKVGVAKGSYDLLHAIARLRDDGVPVTLLAMTNGPQIDTFREAVTDLELQDQVMLLPFVPHWRVPGFIRACDAVCFLERDFPIAIHGPTVPTEVLSCGVALVVSGEIAARQLWAAKAIPGRDVVVVDDPTDHAGLADQIRTLVDDPGLADRIGKAGAGLVDGVPGVSEFAEALEKLIERVTAPSMGEPAPLAEPVADWFDLHAPWVEILFGERLAEAIAAVRSELSKSSVATNEVLGAVRSVCLRLSSGHLGANRVNDALAYLRAVVSPTQAAEVRAVALDGEMDPARTAGPRTVGEIMCFTWDVPGFLEAALKDPETATKLLHEAREDEAVIGFSCLPNGDVRQVRISRGVLQMLGLCDGHLPPRDVVEEMIRAGATPESCQSAMNRLTELGIIQLGDNRVRSR